MDKIRHGASGVVESFSVHCHGHGLLMLRRIVSNCCLLNAFSSEWAAERTSPMSFVSWGSFTLLSTASLWQSES